MISVSTALLLAFCAYLIGSVPFGLLIARARGIDIRRVGSGNIGATNVFRCVGKGWGILTFACDAFKGFASSFLPLWLANHSDCISHGRAMALFCACMAVIGHNWPVFLRFKGGKGVAVTVGALLGISPPATGIGMLLWICVFLLSRYVSLASLVAAAGVSVHMWLTREPGEFLLPGVMTILALLIVWRHKSNIHRLATGTEHRFSFRKKK